MSRQQFLVELSQYLTFVSPEDKEKILAGYSKMFEDAGEEGTAPLLAELGTPMKITIELKRRLEAGEDIVPRLEGEDAAEREAAVESEAEAETEPAPTEAARSPGEDEPSAPAAQTTAIEPPGEEAVSTEEPSAAQSVSEEPAPTEEPAPIDESPAEAPPAEEPPTEEAPKPEAPTEEPAAETPAAEDTVQKADNILAEDTDLPPLDMTDTQPFKDGAVKSRVSHAAPLTGHKRVFAAIGSVLLSLVVCLAFVALGALGMLLIIAMGDFVVTGFGLFYRLADALLTIGLGLVAGAVGIVVVWTCVWAAVTLTEKLTCWMCAGEKEAEEI